MSLDKCYLKNQIIIPTLIEMKKHSTAAVNLMLGTAAVESDFGSFDKQIKGSALGIYQMELDTYNWLWKYLSKKPAYRTRILKASGVVERPSFEDLKTNLKFATAMARLKYWTIKAPLPYHDNVNDLALYWKKYYNTYLGKGTVEDFVKKYHQYV